MPAIPQHTYNKVILHTSITLVGRRRSSPTEQCWNSVTRERRPWNRRPQHGKVAQLGSALPRSSGSQRSNLVLTNHSQNGLASPSKVSSIDNAYHAATARAQCEIVFSGGTIRRQDMDQSCDTADTSAGKREGGVPLPNGAPEGPTPLLEASLFFLLCSLAMRSFILHNHHGAARQVHSKIACRRR